MIVVKGRRVLADQLRLAQLRCTRGKLKLADCIRVKLLLCVQEVVTHSHSILLYKMGHYFLDILY